MTLRGRRKQEIKKLVREARDRARPPEAASTPPPTAEEIFEAQCVCGDLLTVPASENGRPASCAACGRRFMASLAEDPATGGRVLCPMYFEDPGQADSTLTAETIDAVPRKREPKEDTRGALDEQVPPEPPPEIRFSCPCGGSLVARKENYDKRGRCPACGSRLILTLVWDAADHAYVVTPLRMDEPPGGDTKKIPRV
jgi:DNA-directed RNA polymerase subunit RPC12/RpoP